MTDHDTITGRWLQTAQHAVNADPAFRQLGSIDVDMAVGTPKSAWLVTFSGFTCHGVRKLEREELRDADFLVEMTARDWAKFIAGRRSGSGPSLAELDVTEGCVKAPDPRKKLEFFRYHTSIQAFFDAGAARAA